MKNKHNNTGVPKTWTLFKNARPIADMLFYSTNGAAAFINALEDSTKGNGASAAITGNSFTLVIPTESGNDTYELVNQD